MFFHFVLLLLYLTKRALGKNCTYADTMKTYPTLKTTEFTQSRFNSSKSRFLQLDGIVQISF